MKVGYLVNQYPKVSHTFIRREIAALEAMGANVQRYSVRPSPDKLVDDDDVAEQAKTKVLLADGAQGVLKEALTEGLRHPLKAFKAAALAAKMGVGSERGLLRHMFYWAEACALLHWCRSAGIEHLHAHFGTNSTTVAMLCHALGGPPFSFTVHGPEEFDKAEAIGLPIKLSQASFAVAISHFGRAQLWRNMGGEAWQKVHVVRCGVDEDFFREQPSPIPTEPNLVCVGRLCEQKGQLILLEAAAKLRNQGINFNLTLVGDGEMRPAIEEAIAHHGLKEQVHITGWQSTDEVRRHIQAARALVLPSFAEGLPVVIMESLALGRPVISTYVAAIPELVNDKNGWLVPAGDVESLCQAMRKALEASADELQTLGADGRERVREQHDVRANAAKLQQLFLGEKAA